ncbi:MAG: serine/threonine protein kinase, partial [Myxococcales bacterium]|nr:serine/threonine protein kinase [Myxococcales bacterium]
MTTMATDPEPPVVAAGAPPRGSVTRTIEDQFEFEAARLALGLTQTRRPVPVGPEQRYLVREQLGRGSMGAVYLADDLRLRRAVAIKVVARRIDHDWLERRLQREAQALAALRHPNVIQVYDLATTEAGELFITMEYVAGEDLRRWQAGRTLDARLEAYLGAGRGLAAAHDRGIVHRDFKPDNVMVEPRTPPRVLVGDFGLAGGDLDRWPVEGVPDPERPLGTRGLLGTLAYMAPEQLRREHADARSDQHQFCVALWEAVAGTRPFPDQGRDLDRGDELPPRPRAMPRWLHRVLARGLAFDRVERHASMAALLAALQRGMLRRRARPWVLGLGSLVAVGAGAASLLQPDACAGIEATMDRIWTTQARAEVEASLRRAPVAYADTLTRSVVERLDQAATQWRAHARAGGEASPAGAAPEPALERRQACLDRWAQRMGRRVERLRSLEPQLAEQAFELVEPLLLSGSPCRLPPPLLDAEVEAAVERAHDLELLGVFDEALDAAEAAVALAGERGPTCQADAGGATEAVDSHELAAALHRLGHIQAARGAAALSLDALGQARLHALACDDDARFAEIQIHGAKVLAADLRQVDEAEVALAEARATLRRRGEPPDGPHRHDEWMAAGWIATRHGDHPGARQAYQRGLDVLGVPQEHPLAAAKLITNIGVAYQYEGRRADAAQAYARAEALVSTALGAEHPQARAHRARGALNLGLLALEHREHDAAVEHFQRVVDHGDAQVGVVEPGERGLELRRAQHAHAVAHPGQREGAVEPAQRHPPAPVLELVGQQQVGLVGGRARHQAVVVELLHQVPESPRALAGGGDVVAQRHRAVELGAAVQQRLPRGRLLVDVVVARDQQQGGARRSLAQVNHQVSQQPSGVLELGAVPVHGDVARHHHQIEAR